MAWSSSKWRKFCLSSSIWPWRSRSIIPQNIRDLNKGLLHLWFKFGDPSLNGWWVFVWTSSGLIHRHTDRQTDAAMTIPGGQNWPWVRNSLKCVPEILTDKSLLFQAMACCCQSWDFKLIVEYWHYGCELTEAKWLIHVSVNQTLLGSDNGLSPGQHQAII